MHDLVSLEGLWNWVRRRQTYFCKNIITQEMGERREGGME